MLVVHIIIGLNVGGAELMLKRLIEGQGQGVNTNHCVISLTDIGIIGHQLQQSGIRVIPLGMRNSLFSVITFFKLREELKRLKPDIVQTWMYHSDFIGGLAARTIGIKSVIWNVRNTNIRTGSLGKYCFRRLCGLVSHIIPHHIIYVSHSAKTEHVKFGFMKSRTSVIGNGFDINKFNYLEEHRINHRHSMNLNRDDVAVFSVGRYDPAKDHRTFIEAICNARKINSKIKGVLIGREIPLSEFGLSKDDIEGFINLGEVNNLHELLSAADIFCLHSITEGFPNVLGEAMSVGLTCITTKAGDAELILSNKKYAVDIRDNYSLSKLMIDLSYSKGRKSLGLNNRMRIIDNYSLDKILNIYQNLYSKVYDETLS